MRFCVMGAGAVGCYFGGRLIEAGESVAFVARGATLASLRERGLRIESPRGNAVLEKVEATDLPMRIGVVDAVLLAVKTWQVRETAALIREVVGPATAVIPLQNGVEAPSQLAEVLPAANVLGGTCKIVAMKTAPNVVRHVGAEPSIALGELVAALPAEVGNRAQKIGEALRKAGITVEVSQNIMEEIWKKLLFLAPASAIGAASRVPLGLARETPQVRALLRGGMEEVHRLSAAKGVPLAEGLVDATLAFLDGLPAESTASMQRDLVEGRPSELEAIVGAVVRLSQEAGLAAPIHTMLYSVLLPQEGLARQALQTRS